MKNKKTWLTLSAVCVILGIIILTVGRILGGSPGFYIDRYGVHTSGDEIAEAVYGSMELEDFDSMELDVDYADVEVVVSDRFAVEYCIPGEYGEPVCEVKNHKLLFKENTHMRIWNFTIFSTGSGISWNGEEYYVRIEVPAKWQSDNILIDMDDGNLVLPSINAEELKIDNAYGSISLEAYTGERLLVSMEDGLFSADMIDARQAEIKNEYGNIKIERAVGGDLLAELQDGDFWINNLNVKKIEIDNEYGDVHLGVEGDIYEYEYELDTEYGYISIADGKWKKNYSEEGMRYQSEESKARKIEVFCEDGDIEIYQSR